MKFGRRNFIKGFLPVAASLGGLSGCVLNSNSAPGPKIVKKADGGGDPRIRGPFPILSTPITQSGNVDYETLSKEANFVDACGVNGMIWPQSDDSIELLNADEKLKGMEVLAQTLQGKNSTIAFGCNGVDKVDLLVYARHVENLASKYPTTNIAIISRPPSNGKSQDDIKNYYLELEKNVNRPVIIQTGGGIPYKGPVPDVEMMVDLAKRNPKVFGYIKEEMGNVDKCNARMLKEVAAKPCVHTVFSAWGGWQWLYQSRQLGSEGLITERPAYSDLLAYIWEQMENGDANGTLNDAYSKYLLMLNLSYFVKGSTHDQLRGAHLYVLQMRGIFKNRLSREFEIVKGRRVVPKSMIVKNQELSQSQIDEIEACFSSLRPYLKFQNPLKIA